MPRTLLAFHAHPDDEALLTSGTLARAAAEGHRVVLVVATDGDEGLASAEFTSDGRLGERRWEELRESARALGVKRVEHLGYADSGLGPQTLPDPPGRVRFVRADVEEAAGRLATILREERADVLLTYDRNGGYGHRDHVKVHQVGARAAVLAQTPRVLQATVPRDTICRAIALAGRFYPFPPGFDPSLVPACVQPPLGDHPPHRRPPPPPRQARVDARPRLPGHRRRRRRPHAGGLPAHPPPAVRPGLRS